MEEKERYEIHIYDDICVDLYDNGVLDKSINDTYKLEELLNQQSKRIKELENKLDIVRKKDIIIRQNCRQGYIKDLEEMNNLREENQQLNQQLHDLPKKIVEEIKEWIKSQIIYCGGKANEVDILIANASNQVLEDLQNILDTILKKYGGEYEN